MMLNTTGTKNKVATVAKINPPMTARPRGAFCSPPSPIPSAIGTMPMIMASAVINTGRIRVYPASRAASQALCPSRMRSRAKEITRMLFAVATPMHITAPVSDGTLRVVCVSRRIQMIPASAPSSPVIMIKGSSQDWKFTTISRYTRTMAMASPMPRPTNDDRMVSTCPRRTIRVPVETMRSSFVGLGIGLAMAIVLVYLLIVVNFQSWLDPFIIITGLLGALAGIIWMLLLTHTTLNVPSLTGAVMCMGVATANSILVISFARERMRDGLSARDAALEAGYTRIRPVLMTALAMVIGMVPMALGMGEGGEQNAPLGRAVIGGLIFATVATLFFVPVIFSVMHGGRKTNRVIG